MINNAGKAPAIATEHLTKQFGRTLAVGGLELEVAQGSVFGLIGPNGAGKSTTIRMLMGILRPTAGRVRLLGQDVLDHPLEIRQSVGYVPESHNIDRWMRVEHVIGFCRSMYDNWNDLTCQELLKLFDLDPRQKVRHLSKGMKVKLSLVLAVAHEPKLLILDEPMAGLDPLAREEFLDGVLRTICDRGQTVLFSTHSLDDVQRLADTVGILFEGKLLVHRRIDELLASTKRLRATLHDGSEPGGLPDSIIWHRVQGREWMLTVRDFSPDIARQIQAQEGVENVEVLDIGLEDLFKDLVKGQRATS